MPATPSSAGPACATGSDLFLRQFCRNRICGRRRTDFTSPQSARAEGIRRRNRLMVLHQPTLIGLSLLTVFLPGPVGSALRPAAPHLARGFRRGFAGDSQAMARRARAAGRVEVTFSKPMKRSRESGGGSEAVLTAPKRDFRSSLNNSHEATAAASPKRAKGGSGAAYSITSSARASNVGGTARSSTFAVLRFIVNSVVVIC